MKRFADLFDAIDRTTSTNAKVAAMVRYFQSAPPADAAWALLFLSGGKVKRLVSSTLLRDWACQQSQIAPWLFNECYAMVGDLAETISLLVSRDQRALDTPLQNLPLHQWMSEQILPLQGAPEQSKRQAVLSWWQSLDRTQIFLINKILTGELRVGVSQTLVERALAEVSGIEKDVIAHRLSGNWQPTPQFFSQLISKDAQPKDADSRPYPFFLASPVEEQLDPAIGIASLGLVSDFQVEWKFDGIRGQILRRNSGVYIWSRGQDLITDRFPELAEAAMRLSPGTVLDGEILAMRDGKILPFAVLQRRIGRLNPSARVLTTAPVSFIAYDLLEHEGKDLRELPQSQRRELLEQVVATAREPRITTSELVSETSWETLIELRKTSRTRGVEGLMLKRKNSPYRAGRVRGDWWKWKIDPYTVDAVLVYAQPGHGRRANLLTDYTFAVWHNGELSVFAKAYSGLNQEEIDELDRWIRQNTLERFGPVRVVKPIHVFELGFEAIARSDRHKSGFAVRFPRILRWRRDKPPDQADSLKTIEDMLKVAGEYDTTELKKLNRIANRKPPDQGATLFDSL